MNKRKRKKAIIVLSCLFFLVSPLAIVLVDYLEKKGVHMPVMIGAYLQVGMLIILIPLLYLILIHKPSDDKPKKNQNKDEK